MHGASLKLHDGLQKSTSTDLGIQFAFHPHYSRSADIL